MASLLQRLIPDTLGARIVLVLLVGLMAFHLGSLWLHQAGIQTALGTSREQQLAEQLAATKRAVAELPRGERDRMAHALSSATVDIHWGDVPTVQEVGGSSPRIEALRTRLQQLVPELRDSGLRIAYGEDGHGGTSGEAFQHLLVGSLPLPDETWLSFSAALFRPPAAEHATLLSTTAMGVGILILGFIVVRLIGRPLRELSEAADKIGREKASITIPEAGPYEVRHAAQAFNRMQARIAALIDDRTRALAAVSHDLRTPIARLRLRAGFLEDAEVQRQIDADLDEMDAMIGSTLAYLRGESEQDQETARVSDLSAILQTLCDDAMDAGKRASYAGPTQVRLTCRPIGIKRAFANLLDNAIKYGDAARVTLRDVPGSISVFIDDDGPGISAADREVVFEPFRRLDPSRNRGTGGAGLGLTIARQVVERHGGTIELADRAEGGLRVVVRLPRGG